MKRFLITVCCLITLLSSACSNGESYQPEIKAVILSPQQGELSVGGSGYLGIEIQPTTLSDKTMVWTSSDEAIATVDQEGLVNGLTAGEVTITATSPNGVTGVSIITVVWVETETLGFKDNEYEVYIGETATTQAVFNPEYASDKKVTYKIENEKIASVDDKGVVTGIAKGTTKLLAINDSGITGSCKITVARKAVWYDAGMYEVGKDIPAGTYYIEATGNISAYFSLDKNASGKFSSIIANDNFSTFTYIKAKKGQYLTVDRGMFTLAADAPKPQAYNGVYDEGMYRVGKDIPAGKYKLTATSDYMGYVEIDRNCSHRFRAIISNANFSKTKYVKVKKANISKWSERNSSRSSS